MMALQPVEPSKASRLSNLWFVGVVLIVALVVWRLLSGGPRIVSTLSSKDLEAVVQNPALLTSKHRA